MAIDPRTSGARRRRLPYWASYGVVALILTAVTAFFALVVLPQRFVLHAGLRESGISFPARRPGFAAVSRGRIVQPPPRRIPPAAPGEGPAERFWRGILPLLETGRYEKALPLFRQYLEHHPEDTDVWREYALALIRAGRPAEAEAAIEHLGAPNDRLAARLALARFWRDRGETDRAIEAYRDLVMAYPENRTLRRELARALSWAERYDEAAQVFAELLGQDREDEALRLELARVLYWAGRLPEAREVLAGISPDSREAAEAVALDGRLAELLARRPPSPPVDEPPVVRARRAAAEGDLEAAARLYGEALEMSPDDAELWLEWVDFLQVRLADDEAARKALERYGERFGLTPDLSFRLAQLEAWAGRNAEARERLEALIAEDPSRAEAWTLLGDLRRWAGDRPGAADAYRRALALDPQSEQAAAGLAEVRRQTEAVVAAREPEGAGPRAEGFLDSDDYRRFDLAGTSRFRWGVTALRTTAGYRTLRGLDLGGLKRTEEGVFGEVEISHWWREATIRTALSGGLEHLDAFGLEPTFGGLLEIPNADGYAFFARATHGPAYPITRTLESVIEPVYADQLAVSLYHALGARWSVLFVGDATHLAQPAEDNFRWNGGISLSRRLTPALSAGVGSRFLSFGRPATRVGLRRLYWDPSAFWATDVSLALRSPGREGWGYYASLAPGFALIDEREVPGTDLVPQIRTEAGVSFLGERTTFSADLFYGRGRERDYSSFGFELQLSVRPW